MALQPAAGQSCSGWEDLPLAAVGRLGRGLRPSARAALRTVCKRWGVAVAQNLDSLHIGPGDDVGAALSADLGRLFPSISSAHLTYSSCREYSATSAEEVVQLLAGLPQLQRLAVTEVQEVEAEYHLGTPLSWQVLEDAVAPLSSRLQSLVIDSCFWQHAGLFSTISGYTSLTELRLVNVPLETAAELQVLHGLKQLLVLEFGVIYDGESSDHDVPQALEGIGALTQLRELCVPMWRRSLGGQAHPLAPALSGALRALTGLESLSVDGKFNHLRVVSTLTKLTALRSASPLSQTGWEAVACLPHLQLLGSFTPTGQVLRVGAAPLQGHLLPALPCRPHLADLDLSVAAPVQLEGVQECTRLTSLTIRGLAQFSRPAEVAATLQALRQLPSSLHTLTLDGLVPLSGALLQVLAGACPLLQQLHVIDKAAGTPAAQLQQQQGGSSVSAAAAAAAAAAASGAGGDAAGLQLPASEPGAHPLQLLQHLTSLRLEAGPQQGGSSSNPSSSGGSTVEPCSPPAGYAIMVDQLPHSLTHLSLVGPWRLLTGSLYERLMLLVEQQVPLDTAPPAFHSASGSFLDHLRRLKLGSATASGSGGGVGAVAAAAGAAGAVVGPGAAAGGARAVAAGEAAATAAGSDVQQGSLSDSPGRRSKRSGSMLHGAEAAANGGEHNSGRAPQHPPQQQAFMTRPGSPSSARQVKRQKSQTSVREGWGVSQPLAAAAAAAPTTNPPAAPWPSQGPQDSVAIAVAMAVAQANRHQLPYGHGQHTMVDQVTMSGATGVAASNMRGSEDNGDSMSDSEGTADSSGAVGENSVEWSTAAPPRLRGMPSGDVADSAAVTSRNQAAAHHSSNPAQQHLEQQSSSAVELVASLPVLTTLQLAGCGAQPAAVAALLATSYGQLEALLLGDVLLLAEPSQQELHQPNSAGPAGAAAAKYLQAPFLLQLPVHWPAVEQLQLPSYVVWELAAAAAALQGKAARAGAAAGPPSLWRVLMQLSLQQQQEEGAAGGGCDADAAMSSLHKFTVSSSRCLVFAVASQDAVEQLSHQVVQSLVQLPQLRRLTLAGTGLHRVEDVAALLAGGGTGANSSSRSLLNVQQQHHWGLAVPPGVVQGLAPGDGSITSSSSSSDWEHEWDAVAEQLLQHLPRCCISVAAAEQVG